MAAGRRLRHDRHRHRDVRVHLPAGHHRPEPPLFYAHPDNRERFRYLVFAEQFRDLFEDFSSPLADFWQK